MSLLFINAPVKKQVYFGKVRVTKRDHKDIMVRLSVGSNGRGGYIDFIGDEKEALQILKDSVEVLEHYVKWSNKFGKAN